VRVVVQRVSSASVCVDGRPVGEIGRGLLLLLGVGDGDTEEQAVWLAKKCRELRIFPDDEGKMARSVEEIGGSALVVSQFTLYGRVERGRRPDFTHAAAPDRATALYEFFVRQLRSAGLPVQTGVFAAMMQVELVNDGPVPLLLEKYSAPRPLVAHELPRLA